jgi:subfamily B ATP-binding cassette protein HlyB/CyaB
MPCAVPQNELLWALGSVCALHRQPFSAELVEREFPAPCTDATLIAAGRAVGLRVQQITLDSARIERMVFPLLVGLRAQTDGEAVSETLAIVTAAAEGRVVLFRAGQNTPQTVEQAELASLLSGDAWLMRPEGDTPADPDAAGTTRHFGFRWFVPELLKHKHVWRDVLLASLALQLIALATPLFTQAIIDKVVVHRTQSTLIAIAVAMVIFTVFTSLLT